MAAYRWVKARAPVYTLRRTHYGRLPLGEGTSTCFSCRLCRLPPDAVRGGFGTELWPACCGWGGCGLIDCATRPTGACACLVADAGVLGWRGGLPDACRRDSGSTIGPRSGAENMSWLRQEQSQVHFTFFHFGRVFNRSSLTRLAVAMAVLCTCACSRRLPSAAARFLRLRSVMQACMCLWYVRASVIQMSVCLVCACLYERVR